MPFDFKNLDETTRKYMLEELDSDIAAGAGEPYLSTRFTPAGDAAYPSLLRKAIRDGDDVSLESDLDRPEYWKPVEGRTGSKSQMAKVPVSAAETFAGGQFNRYYTRGLCLRAIAEKIDKLIIYRAKAVDAERSESVARIGAQVDAQEMLDAQRAPVTSSQPLAWKPNSGLSVRLPK